MGPWESRSFMLYVFLEAATRWAGLLYGFCMAGVRGL